MSDGVCKRCGALPGELCRTPAGYKLAARHGSGSRKQTAHRSPHRLQQDAAEAAAKWRNKERRARLKIKELEAMVRKLEAELAELRGDPAPVQRKQHGNAKWQALGS